MAGWMRCLWIVLSVSLLLVPDRATSAPWQPAVDGLTVVVVEKKVRTDRRPPCAGCALPGSKALEPLPAAVLQRAGAHAVQYEGFLTTWLPAPAARNSAPSAHDPGCPSRPGDQPMTVVFSAGNHAWDCSTQTEGWNSVSSPAVAKNVIAVGATESDRPAPEPPLACGGCFTADGTPNGRPPDVDASHVGRVASFSGRGRLFEPFPAAHLAHDTRIKPDLVAPGARVFSTVPYAFAEYDQKPLATGCARYHSSPNTSNTYHTYGTGTSFAAPGGQTLQVRVTGVNVPQGRTNGRQSFSIYAYNLTAP